MNSLFSRAALAVASAVGCFAHESAPLLVPGPSIEVAGSHGKFDFLEIDAVNRRLLASHTADGTVDIFDLATQRLLARPATGGAQDATFDPVSGRYFASVGEEKRIAIVDAQTFAVTATIPTEGPLDAILLEPKNRCLYVAHDDGRELWVVSADTGKIVGAVAIPGAPEYLVYDAATDRIYLNIKTTDEVVAIDLASGRVIATAPIAAKVDQIAFDPGLRRIYCASSETLSVVQETADGLAFLGDVASFPGAKNVAVDAKTHAVWTTCTDGKNAYAKSWLLP